MKQWEIVLQALKSGPATSNEIAKATGVPVKTVSTHLSNLHDLGIVRRFGRIRESRRGRSSYVWEAVD